MYHLHVQLEGSPNLCRLIESFLSVSYLRFLNESLAIVWVFQRNETNKMCTCVLGYKDSVGSRCGKCWCKEILSVCGLWKKSQCLRFLHLCFDGHRIIYAEIEARLNVSFAIIYFAHLFFTFPFQALIAHITISHWMGHNLNFLIWLYICSSGRVLTINFM